MSALLAAALPSPRLRVRPRFYKRSLRQSKSQAVLLSPSPHVNVQSPCEPVRASWKSLRPRSAADSCRAPALKSAAGIQMGGSPLASFSLWKVRKSVSLFPRREKRNSCRGIGQA